MNRFREAIDAAEQARMQDQTETAIALYREALGLIDDPSACKIWQVYQMLGVTLLSHGDFSNGLIELDRARSAWPEGVSTAALLRDIAKAYMMLDHLDIARDHIDASLREANDNLSERGATMGFLARLQMRQGLITQALESFGTADWLLHRSDNRHYELYNKIPFLAALIAGGEFSAAQELALDTLHLAGKYGSEKHAAEVDELIMTLSEASTR